MRTAALRGARKPALCYSLPGFPSALRPTGEHGLGLPSGPVIEHASLNDSVPALWLRRTAEQSFTAFALNCTHLGCPVNYVSAAESFVCPCHGGVYDFQGKRIGGPPVRPLDQFQARTRDGQVELGPRFSVTSQLEPVRARDPGEFTGGIWEYLYPPRPSTFPPP